MECSRQAPLSVGFSRQEYCSGVVIPFSRGSPQSRDSNWVSCRFFTVWATRKAQAAIDKQNSEEGNQREKRDNEGDQDSGPVGGGKGSLKRQCASLDEGDRKLGTQKTGEEYGNRWQELSQVPPVWKVDRIESQGWGITRKHIEAMCGAGSCVAPTLSRALSTPAGLSGSERICKEVGKEDGHMERVWGNIQASSPGWHLFLQLAPPKPTSPRGSLCGGTVHQTLTEASGLGDFNPGWPSPVLNKCFREGRQNLCSSDAPEYSSSSSKRNNEALPRVMKSTDIAGIFSWSPHCRSSKQSLADSRTS